MAKEKPENVLSWMLHYIQEKISNFLFILDD